MDIPPASPLVPVSGAHIDDSTVIAESFPSTETPSNTFILPLILPYVTVQPYVTSAVGRYVGTLSCVTHVDKPLG